jgi:tetratricopeptide (TPR) repeat protein
MPIIQNFMKCFFLILNILGASWAAAQTDSLEKIATHGKGEQRVKALNELFRSNFNSDPVKAVAYAKQALTLATEIEDFKGMAAANNNIGVTYKSQGALDKSLEYYTHALTLYEKIKNKDGIATTKSNIGAIYSTKKDYTQAMKYFEEASTSFEELGNQEKIIGSMNNLGILYTDLQLFEQALKYFLRAIQLSEKTGKITADPLNNIGNLYFRQGNYQLAADYYEKAMALANKGNDQNTLLYSYINLGELYAKSGQAAKAQAYLDSASVLCEKLQAYALQPVILKILATNFAKQNKMKEAYEAMLRYDQAKDKTYGEENTRRMMQMGMALDLQEKEKEIENNKAKDDLESLELKNSRTFIVTIVLAVIVLIGLINFFYSKNRWSKT